MAYLVVLVIDNLDHCHPVLDAWEEAGVTGVTILESSGIGRARRAGLRRDDYPLMLSLTDILQSKERHHRTVFSVVDTDEQVEMLLTHAGFLKAASQAADADELQARLAQDPLDCEARYQLAASRLVIDDYAGAMDELLLIMKADREFNDDIGRRGLLAIFSVLGKEHALVAEYQNRMRDIIYS